MLLAVLIPVWPMAFFFLRASQSRHMVMETKEKTKRKKDTER